MNTTTSEVNAQPRARFTPTPLCKLQVDDVFCISGFGMRDRIAYTTTGFFRKTVKGIPLDFVSATYQQCDARCNLSTVTKDFEASKTVLFMFHKVKGS